MKLNPEESLGRLEWKTRLVQCYAMITFLVVGRNDGYGINLHKRTAISLNALAELCDDETDEIIYVDCNTDKRDLTLSEAIADTLTPQAQRRLKTYRITQDLMETALGVKGIRFSDELSRNVGIRRSNPANSWLLSTNCDIIIRPLDAESLRPMLTKLEPRFYVSPRVSIPDDQWQLLNRMDCAQIFDFCDSITRRGFRFPAEQPEEWLRFGSIGDFQLAPREQWFAIRGCEEAMIKRGHSDTNNSKRLSLLNGSGRTPDLTDYLRVFHLEHNFPNTFHPDESTLNDRGVWVDSVTDYKARNSDNWGLPDTQLPLIRHESSTGLTAGQIHKMRPRKRNLLTQTQTKLSAIFWKRISKLTNSFQQGSPH